MQQARTSGVAPAVVCLREDDECPTSTGALLGGVHLRATAIFSEVILLGRPPRRVTDIR